MDSPFDVSLTLAVCIDPDREVADLQLACANVSPVSLRLPRLFSAPDPFLLELSNAEGREFSEHTASHSFSFIADPHSTLVLSPGESTIVQADLLFLFSGLGKGNYRLRVSLNLREYLVNLRRKHPDVDASQPYVAAQSNPVTFFVPWDFRSARWERYWEMLKEQEARHSFCVWKPWTWRQLSARKMKWPPDQS